MASPQQPVQYNTVNAAEVELLRQLSRLIVDLTRAGGECRRISRGSPGAGQLSGSTQQTRNRLNEIKRRLDNLLFKHSQIPGAHSLKFCYSEFDVVLNELVDEGGNDHGYTARVHYLERINYHSGVVKGRADALVEIMEYWQERAREQEEERRAGLLNGLQGNRSGQPTAVPKTDLIFGPGLASRPQVTRNEVLQPTVLASGLLTAAPKIQPGLTSRPPVTIPTAVPRTYQPTGLTSRPPVTKNELPTTVPQPTGLASTAVPKNEPGLTSRPPVTIPTAVPWSGGNQGSSSTGKQERSSEIDISD